MAADCAAEVLIVEEPGCDRLVLVHAVDEQALEGLVEDQLEGVERVGRGGLLQRLVGDGLLADLAEEEFIGLCELVMAASRSGAEWGNEGKT